MSIYFDFKTIKELIRDKYYIEQKGLRLPRVDILRENNSVNFIPMDSEAVEDTSNFTPDDWVNYITPLVDRALEEANAGNNPEHLYQQFILSGVLIGKGKTPQEAIEQVEDWENTGISQLLAKSSNRGYYYY